MTKKTWILIVLCVAVISFAGSSAFVQEQQKTAPEESKSNSGAPLGRYKITPASLPPPNLGPDAENPPRGIPRPPNAELRLLPGFAVSTFAEGDFKFVRWMALAPNGDVFVTDAEAKKVIILRDTDNDGKADARFTFASDLDLPFGLAFWNNYLYVGVTNAVVRFAYKAGQVAAQGSPEKIADLPGRGYRQHWTRNLIFDPSGKKLYVTVGSESNVSVEKEPLRATISEYNPDGSGHRVFASGLRNPIGLAFHPATKRLWATVQERDRLGDDLPPDYLTEVKENGFYGWPYSYIGKNEDPRRKGERPDLVEKALVPEVLIQAHSAVLGLVFYDGRMFPREYRGDAFIALHGSWNRTKRTGYKIIRVPFKNNRPDGSYEDFLTGWMLDENQREVWGRPAGLLVLKDGSMLVSDDGANKIWRVSYRNKNH